MRKVKNARVSKNIHEISGCLENIHYLCNHNSYCYANNI